MTRTAWPEDGLTDWMQERESAVDNDGKDLRGQVAVVTGASTGIGRAIALEFARAGAHVLVHAGRNRSAANDVAGAIRDFGRKSHVCIADLSAYDAQDRLVEEAWTWAGELSAADGSPPGIHTWVNNAGVDVLTGAAAAWSFEDKLAHLWEVDVVASIRLSRDNGSRMREAMSDRFPDDNRCILNMGWDQAATGMAGESGEMFSAIKGAVMAFTKSLAHSLAPQIRVNCLAPGWIKTSWGDHASDYWDQRATSEAMLGRWGTPRDVARVARFLASPSASFLTGQAIRINGGFRGSAIDPRQS